MRCDPAIPPLTRAPHGSAAHRGAAAGVARAVRGAAVSGRRGRARREGRVLVGHAAAARAAPCLRAATIFFEPSRPIARVCCSVAPAALFVSSSISSFVASLMPFAARPPASQGRRVVQPSLASRSTLCHRSSGVRHQPLGKRTIRSMSPAGALVVLFCITLLDTPSSETGPRRPARCCRPADEEEEGGDMHGSGCEPARGLPNQRSSRL